MLTASPPELAWDGVRLDKPYTATLTLTNTLPSTVDASIRPAGGSDRYRVDPPTLRLKPGGSGAVAVTLRVDSARFAALARGARPGRGVRDALRVSGLYFDQIVPLSFVLHPDVVADARRRRAAGAAADAPPAATVLVGGGGALLEGGAPARPPRAPRAAAADAPPAPPGGGAASPLGAGLALSPARARAPRASPPPARPPFSPDAHAASAVPAWAPSSPVLSPARGLWGEAVAGGKGAAVLPPPPPPPPAAADASGPLRRVDQLLWDQEREAGPLIAAAREAGEPCDGGCDDPASHTPHHPLALLNAHLSGANAALRARVRDLAGALTAAREQVAALDGLRQAAVEGAPVAAGLAAAAVAAERAAQEARNRAALGALRARDKALLDASHREAEAVAAAAHWKAAAERAGAEAAAARAGVQGAHADRDAAVRTAAAAEAAARAQADALASRLQELEAEFEELRRRVDAEGAAARAAEAALAGAEAAAAAAGERAAAAEAAAADARRGEAAARADAAAAREAAARAAATAAPPPASPARGLRAALESERAARQAAEGRAGRAAARAAELSARLESAPAPAAHAASLSILADGALAAARTGVLAAVRAAAVLHAAAGGGDEGAAAITSLAGRAGAALEAVAVALSGEAGESRASPVDRAGASGLADDLRDVASAVAAAVTGALSLRPPRRASFPSLIAHANGDGDGDEEDGGFSISVGAAQSAADLGGAKRRRRRKRVAVDVEEGEDAGAAEDARAAAAAAEAEQAAAAAADQAAAEAAAAARRRKAAAAARAAREAAEAEAADQGFSVSVSAPAEEAAGAVAAPGQAPPQPPARGRRKASATKKAAAPPSSTPTPAWKPDAMADTAAAVNEVGAGRAWRHPVRRTVQKWKDMGWGDKWAHAREAAYKRVVWEWEAPNTGTMHLSYARLLDLLAGRNVARLTILGRGRVALVEVPVEGYANDLKTPPSYDRFDADTMYSPAGSRDALEVNRFYVDLPGDVWARGTMMRLARDAAVPVLDAAGRPSPGHARVYDSTTTDVAVLEPLPRSEVVALVDSKGSMALWLLLARAAALAASWVGARLSPPDNPEDETAALMRQLSAHTAIEYNTPGSDGKRDTGVRYADVAGVEPIMATVREYMQLLTGAAQFTEMGARAPRGLIFEGPPGTGKTLLAKAMAGEAGLPFFACNGAEFVEMYEGVAAARVRDLFKVARAVAPSIIFIDEIDALARERGDGPSDPGSQEREQALLALLVEMDGFVRGDPVLCIGATNLADSLDQALVRPGRFDRTLHLGLPSEPNRLKILAVHAAGKPLDRSGDDALLRRAAAKTIGWSGAELANLMNEAAILMVRHGSDAIGWPELAEAIHRRGRTAGASDGPEALAAAVAAETDAEAVAGGPETEAGGALGGAGGAAAAAARARLATVVAARAVGAALTAGLPRVEAASLHSRTPGALAALRFEPTEFGTDGQGWARLGAPAPTRTGGRAWPNATPELVAEAAAAAGVPAEAYIPSPYEIVAGLIVALYVPRAAEVELCGGSGAASTSTLSEAAAAATLASWLAGNAMLHPRRRLAPVPTGDPDAMDNPDALTEGAFGPGDAAAAGALRDAAWARARALVRSRAPAIRAAASVLLGEAGAPSAGLDSADSDGDEDGRIAPGTISGARLVALIESSPVEAGQKTVGPPAWLAAARSAAAASGLAASDVAAALESVTGSLALQDLAGLDEDAVDRALAAAGLKGDGAAAAAAVAREAAVRRFATTPGAEDGPLPPPPPVLPEYRGPALAGWGPGGNEGGLAIPSLKSGGGGGGGGRGV